MPSVILKKSADDFLRRKHPWIFSGAIEKVEGEPANGERVEIYTAAKKLIGRGSYSPSSQIRVRIWSFYPDEQIDIAFFKNKIEQSSLLRNQIFNTEETNSYRLINAENDGLPGLIVDRYNDLLVCQFLSAGADFYKKTIVEILKEQFNPKGIYERSDVDVREKEGLSSIKGVLFGDEPDDLIEIKENGLKFLVDIKNGHKTGFYLDQRDNRKKLTEFSWDKNILNCFSYTGAFLVYALSAGAKHVAQVETSSPATEIAMKNIELNKLDTSKVENIDDDVFRVLRKFRDEGRSFDVIILDPPKFAESVSQVQKASRAYKDINLLAIKLLNPGGVLFTFSCSGHVSPDLFQKIIAGAALDSNRNVSILKFLSQSSDHPLALNFPEGLYLKGLICSVQ